MVGETDINKYIKLKKKYPAEKNSTIAGFKNLIKFQPDTAKEFLFWRDGKVNFVNELRAHRMVDRGQYYNWSINYKQLKKGKDLRRKKLEDVLLEKWAIKPNILKGGHHNEQGKIACNKCNGTELKYTLCGDGFRCVEYEYKCQNCGNKIFHLLRNGTEYRYL